MITFLLVSIGSLVGLAMGSTWIFTNLWGMPFVYAVILGIVFSVLYVISMFANSLIVLKIVALILTLPILCACCISFCKYMWGWNEILVGVLSVVTGIIDSFAMGAMI